MGTNSARLDQLERQLIEMKSAQVTEARIVRIEEKQTYLVQRVDETNQLLRQYIEQNKRAR